MSNTFMLQQIKGKENVQRIISYPTYLRGQKKKNVKTTWRTFGCLYRY